MEQYTKDNPASLYIAMKYFSELSGISLKKEEELPLDKLRTTQHKNAVKKKFKSSLLYSSSDIQVVDKEGRRHAYMQGVNKRYDQCGIEAVSAIVTVYRTINEFGINYESAGEFKEYESGGWYSMIPRYKHNNFYFAYY